MPAANADSRRVLVGVDRSLGAQVALAYAARRAGPNGCLIVAHVLPPLPPGILSIETFTEFQADCRAAGQKLVGRFAAALGSVSHALLAHADRPIVVVPQAAADHPRDPCEHGACSARCRRASSTMPRRRC